MITQSVDGLPHLTSKGDDQRRQKWDRLTFLHGDRIHGSADHNTHCASFNSSLQVSSTTAEILRKVLQSRLKAIASS
jgi:hypothetical protein